MLQSSKTVKAAAKTLLGRAETEYLENRGHEAMDDDTTILVVELNPSGVAPPVTPESSGCCTLM